jgi:excisionase family DNA binding protein
MFAIKNIIKNCNGKKNLKQHADVKLESTLTGSVKTFNTDTQHKSFLSIQETARLLGTSRSTIYRLITGGNLKVVKLGDRSIIKRNEIDKLFQ